jgi:hypothetical protein
MPHRAVEVLFAGGVLAVVGLAIWQVWRGARWEAGALLCLVGFLLLAKVYSPQYDLWLLPLLALLACPWPLWALNVLAGLAYYAAIFLYWHRATGGAFPLDEPALGNLLRLAIGAREAALLLLFAWGLVLLRWPGNTTKAGSPRRDAATTLA